ncbi:DUF2290 domain-containing protein [Aliivibrio salmonicida]|uniref:DUF2290 domain-containing protein n=1 Tax=Aliivibrio salmonicida (strain LFI1238) TaxID=316275 RepID=B6EID7_ALISL|nr:DUF2290 domain-containing protein [Aliivibrio salmonicida]AZL84316.1 DUF2290 domain-containing protein [Aliivibrio salmonicida]CAQ78648.1 hypothetical protein VSAL_I0963 [Aliivibrio salmonicida LFI1238]
MEIRDVHLVESINKFIFQWQIKGLVHDSRNHSVFRKAGGLKEITWGNDGYILKDEEFSSISEYCSLVENRQYSMLLCDGSLFQISYTLDRSTIVKHRLCWYPCPIHVDSSDLDGNDITDIILEKMSTGDIESFRARSPLRFDYAPSQATEDHPTVHMHLSEETCRIPVKSPLCLKEFVTFIVRNFYDVLTQDPSLYQNLKTWGRIDTLTQEQKNRLHINTL